MERIGPFFRKGAHRILELDGNGQYFAVPRIQIAVGAASVCGLAVDVGTAESAIKGDFEAFFAESLF